MKTLVCGTEELFSRLASEIAVFISDKPDCVLALAYDGTLSAVYRNLLELYENNNFSLRETKVFTVAEFEEKTLIRDRLFEEFLSKTDLKPENFFNPDCGSTEDYDGLINAAGGIDLAVLNLGYKGQFGFNEPATQYSSLSHRQKLTESSRREFSALYPDEELPEYGCTMGIKTIVTAKNIFIAASGEEKADAVFDMLYGRDDSTVPAAFLQLPLNVTVYADPAAASKL